MAAITDDEHGACYIQGALFFDQNLNWCRITGWGTENGIMIIFYSPLVAGELHQEGEEFLSLT
jgi:hypothetical protein